MPQVTINVGGRDFKINCGEGEEEGLQTAAKRLDSEIKLLSDGNTNPLGSSVVLMAGLVLADRLQQEEKAREVERSTRTERELEIKRLKAAAAHKPAAKERVLLLENFNETLAEIAARTESLAASIEKTTSSTGSEN